MRNLMRSGVAPTAFCMGLWLTVFLLTASVSPAQDFTSRSIQIVVPAPAGGSADYFARTLAPKISAALKQTVIVENKPGATGVIGARVVIASPANGHTLLLNSIASVVVGPHLTSPIAFDPIEDLTPITPLANVPAVLVVRPELGIRTLIDLIKYAEGHPGKVNAASSGAGTLAALNVAMLQQETGIKLTHVPYKGAPQAITDLLGGHVDVMFSDVSFFLTHIKSGKLVPLAAAASKRLSMLPDVKTTAELGYPNLLAANVYCFFAAPKTSPEIISKLNQVIRGALEDTDVRNSFLTQSATVESLTAEQFAELFQSENKRFLALARTARRLPDNESERELGHGLSTHTTGRRQATLDVLAFDTNTVGTLTPRLFRNNWLHLTRVTSCWR